jgi:predicted RND superfamily exporter protein
MNAMSNFIVKFRWVIIIGFIAVTVLMGTQLRKAEMEADFATMIPHTMGYRASTDKIEEIFGGTDMMIVLFETDDVLNTETLKRLKKIAKAANRL